jgi:integrase
MISCDSLGREEMPEKGGRKPLVGTATPMSTAEMEECRRAVLRASISGTTLKAYEDRIRILREFAKATDGARELEKRHWFVFCQRFAAASKASSKSALEGYRAAIAFHQDLGEITGTWASDPDVVRALGAVMYQAGARKRPIKRGAITREMLGELVDWLTKTGQEEKIEVVVTLFGTHARIEEVMNLKTFDVEEGGILIPNKTCKASTVGKEQPIIRKARESITEEAWKIIWRRATESPPGRLLFPCEEVRIPQLRAALHRASQELGWDEECLNFGVPHCFRHGRVTEMVEEGRAAEVKMAKSTLERYGMPNEGRLGNPEVRRAFRKRLEK